MKKLIMMAAFAAGTCFAQTTPVMVSLVTPIQYPASSYDVTGIKYDFIYGRCRDLKGIDFGLANDIRGDFTGVQLGFVNLSHSLYGVQFGFVNFSDSVKQGLQLGFLNFISRNGWFPVFPFINGKF